MKCKTEDEVKKAREDMINFTDTLAGREILSEMGREVFLERVKLLDWVLRE